MPKRKFKGDEADRDLNSRTVCPIPSSASSSNSLLLRRWGAERSTPCCSIMVSVLSCPFLNW
jgi:hypothetical protein